MLFIIFISSSVLVCCEPEHIPLFSLNLWIPDDNLIGLVTGVLLLIRPACGECVYKKGTRKADRVDSVGHKTFKVLQNLEQILFIDVKMFIHRREREKERIRRTGGKQKRNMREKEGIWERKKSLRSSVVLSNWRGEAKTLKRKHSHRLNLTRWSVLNETMKASFSVESEGKLT